MTDPHTKFRLVTGRDFGRAIRRARHEINPVDAALRAHVAQRRKLAKKGGHE